MPRGRPASFPQEQIEKSILLYASRILVKDKNGWKVVLENNPVWEEINKNEFQSKFQVKSLHIMVTSNRNGILSAIKNKLNIFDHQNKFGDSSIETSLDEDSQPKQSVYKRSEIIYEHEILHEDFTNMTHSVAYANTSARRSNKKRNYLKFKPGVWETYFDNIIHAGTGLTCAFKYKDHHLKIDGSSGNFKATCNCGSKMDCLLYKKDNDNMIASLNITPGSGNQCGIRPLRGEVRNEVCEEIIEAGSVDQYRAKTANEVLKNKKGKPSTMYSDHVLHVALSNKRKEKYVDNDPITALDILKCTRYPHAIHDIGRNPFFVNIWTNEQINCLKKVTKSMGVSMCVDATGLKLQKIKRKYSNTERSLFVYVIAVNCEICQFTTALFITERQTSKDIAFFLLNFHQSGAPMPLEFVCDGSRALLNAAVYVYSPKYTNIDDYAEHLDDDDEINTRIRQDVAHFINVYSKLLKTLPKQVKTLYLAALGALIKSTCKDEASKILKSIFLLSNCEMEGYLEDNKPTECLRLKKWITSLITEEIRKEEKKKEDEEEQNEEVEETYIRENMKTNKWGLWGKAIYDSVVPFFDQDGLEVNAYYLNNINLAKQLLKDLNLIPIWGNLLSNEFSFGRIPATSAPVEGEINKLKQRFRNTFGSSARVDEFVSDSIEFLNGKALINSNEIDSFIETETDDLQSLLCYSCLKKLDGQNVIECSMCNEKVHDYCTEKYSEKKICFKCLNKKEIKKYIGLDEYENWRGLGLPRKKSVKNSIVKKNCDACSAGMLPPEDRQCVTCYTPIHHIDGCSIALPGEDEGFSQKRECISCFNRKNSSIDKDPKINDNKVTSDIDNSNTEFDVTVTVSPKTIASNQERKKDEKTKKRYRQNAKYLGQRKDDVKDSLEWTKNKAIPIIKNGCSDKLAFINIKGQNISLRNTCAFDSLFYLTMLAVVDFPSLKNIISNYKNTFFTMILDTINNGLRQHTYYLRCLVLQEHFELKKSNMTPNVYILDTNIQCAWLINKLFSECPSFKETLQCNHCDFEATRELHKLTMEDIFLKIFNHEEFITSIYDINNSDCPSCKAEKGVKYTLKEIGNFLMIDVFNQDEENRFFALKDFYKCITNPLIKEEKLLLVGVIGIHGVGGFRRRSKDSTNHFTSYVYRRGNTSWMEIDDLQKSSIPRSQNHQVVPRLIMYIKQ